MRSVQRDFGLGYVFLDKKRVQPEILARLTDGTSQKLPAKESDQTLMVYLSGTYPKVVRLSKSIPTFDSGDRMYDSWHDLYLIREKDGKLWAVYATGGYEIAKVEAWGTVIRCPGNIRELLEV